jgi:exonuclease SbcD
VHYSGSPFAVDFGEQENRPSVSLVELTARTAARVAPVQIRSAVPLRTLRGSLKDLQTLRVDPTAWLRVFVAEAPRAGLKEEVQELLPRALEVRIDPSVVPTATAPARTAGSTARSPRELFGEYLATKGIDDPAVGALFNDLYDEVVSA